MQVSETFIVLFSAVFVILIVFFLIKNRRDRKKLENKLNQNYKKPRSHTEGTDIEDRDKV